MSSSKKQLNTTYWNIGVTLIIIALTLICISLHIKRQPVFIGGLIMGSIFLLAVTVRFRKRWGSRTPLYIGISTFYCLFVMMDGVFLNIYWRFFMDALVYIGFGLYLLRARSTPVTFGETYLLLFLPQFAAICIYGYCYADSMMYPLILAPVLAVLLLYILYRAKSYVWLRWTSCTIILAGTAFWAYPNYFNSLTGKEVPVSQVKDARIDLPLITEKGDTTSITQLGNKVVVLDMWMTRCGVCFRKFPEFEELCTIYANDPDVYCAVVNLPLPEEVSTRDAFDAVRKYSFNKLKSPELAQEGNKWGLIGFPETFIFDKQHRLRYEGYTNVGKFSVVNNTTDLIERLKKE